MQPQEALEHVTGLDFVESILLQDDPDQPLEKWWWHLGAIRNGTYPLGLLPEPLRGGGGSLNCRKRKIAPGNRNYLSSFDL